MDVQNAKALTITEGDVRTIHDKDGKQLWGKVAYDTKYAGDATQAGTPTPDSPQAVNVVKGTQTITLTDGVVSDSFTVGLAGKNLFPFTSQNFTLRGITYECQNGNLYLDGTSQGETGSNSADFKANFAFTLPAGTYVVNLQEDIIPCYVKKMSDDTNLATVNGRNTKSATFTLSETTELYLGFYVYQKTFTDRQLPIQLEVGSSPSSYTPYFTPIELAKIGTYQDYIYKSSGNWYVHKAINKYTINTTLMTVNSNYTNVEYAQFDKPTNYVGYGNFLQYPLMCTKATHVVHTAWDSADNISKIFTEAVSIYFWIGFAKGTGLDNIRTALANTEIYYPLTTPTDTQITDATLISQLEAIHEWLTRYGYQSSVVGNLPIIISQTNL